MCRAIGVLQWNRKLNGGAGLLCKLPRMANFVLVEHFSESRYQNRLINTFFHKESKCTLRGLKKFDFRL
jgi:hypothetical protein